MKIGKKLFSLLGTALLATAVAWNFGGATEVQAASYTVNSSVSDVQGNVGDVINLPIHIESTQKLRGLSGKLRGNYDTTVLEFQGMEGKDIPEAVLTSTAGGNFSYLTSSSNTFSSGTLNLKFKVLKCSADPVSVTIRDLYYTDGNESSDKVTLTANVTVNHPQDQREEKVTKEATCTEKGSKSIICKVCGATLETQEIPALGHKAGDWKVTKEATCTEKGSREQRCTVCDEVVKTEEIAALGHKAGDSKLTIEATCTEKGSREQRCTVCDEVVKTEEIAALGHKDGKWKITKESTFTEKGSKELHCAVCDEVIKTAVIPFKGDINGNGKIDLTDVSNMVDSITDGSAVEAEIGDLNNDGVVDLTDVSKLLDLITEGTV